jgi:hypothetical protein
MLAGLVVLLAAIGVVAALAIVSGSQSAVTTPSAVTTEPGAPGRLVASQSTIDLGQVPFDRPAEARFELANTGADTVRLVGAPRVRMLEGC